MLKFIKTLPKLLKQMLIIATVIILSIGVIFPTISAQETSIPEWVKTTAGWWSQDKLSDKEFLNAITFLKKSNIISVPKIEKVNSTDSQKSTQWYYSVTDALSNPQNMITHSQINGKLEDNKSKVPITITVIKPDEEYESIKVLSDKGKYSGFVLTEHADIPGIYTIKIEANGDLVENRYAYLEGTIQEIPEWIKNNAKWWSEDKIKDQDFIQGVQFLVQTGMINPQRSSNYTNTIDEQKAQLVSVFEKKVDPKEKLKRYEIIVNDYGRYSADYKHNLPHLREFSSIQDCMIKARSDDGSISTVEKTYCQQANRVYLDEGFVRDSDGNIINYDYGNSPRSENLYDDAESNYGSYDYSYELPRDYSYNYDYSDNYGYDNADVQEFLDRADYYAKQWLDDIEPYAEKWANGQMSYSEYERLGMQSFDYYADQFVNDFDSYWNSKYGYYP